MKYQKELDEMFSYFHESWMDENDKENFNKDILKEMNTTMEGLDIMFEQGVEKGYSIETQLSLAKQLISSVV